MMGELPDDEAKRMVAVLEQIKETHRAGGHELSREETIEFITRPIYMGPPKAVKLNNDGTPRKNAKNQYDLANKRRIGHFHRLKRLPEAGAAKRREKGNHSTKQIEWAHGRAAEWCQTQAQFVAAIQEDLLELTGNNPPDASTIRKALKLLRLRQSAPK